MRRRTVTKSRRIREKGEQREGEKRKGRKVHRTRILCKRITSDYARLSANKIALVCVYKTPSCRFSELRHTVYLPLCTRFRRFALSRNVINRKLEPTFLRFVFFCIIIRVTFDCVYIYSRSSPVDNVLIKIE